MTKTLNLILAAAGIAAAAPAAAAVALVNGSFEQVGAFYASDLGGIYAAAGWQNLSSLGIQASSVGLGQEGPFILGGGDGSRYLRLASDYGFQGVIGQDLGTMRAGDTYTLTARYSGGASVNADWQAFLQLGDGLGIAPATVYGARGVEVTLGQTGSLSLSYTAQAGDTGKSLFVTAYAVASGPGQARRGGFDDLVLTTTSAPALPEPASWALMVTGFALVGARRRRAPAAA